MDDNTKEDLLRSYYYDSKNPAAYAGPQKLFRVINKKYPNQISLRFIKQWLNNQDSYSLQKQVRHRFKTANVRVTFINEQWDIDLLSMRNLSKDNDGVNYLLCAIDIFTRKLWVKPLKNKTAKEVLKAMKEILQKEKPLKIRSDKGSEFSNQWFKKFMKDKNIYFFTTQNLPKANYVERVQRTLKTTLYRLMRQTRSYRYIDDLQDVVASYNASPHRSLNYLSPNDINKSNEADVWAYMYLKNEKGPRKGKPKFHFKKGDLVRISFIKQPFRRAYQEQYTTEVFKVSSVFLKQGIAVYRLIDLLGRDVKGLFYSNELIRVSKDEDSLWFIDTILKKKRGKNKKLMYYVSWLGFPKEFNSWINADEVKDITSSNP